MNVVAGLVAALLAFVLSAAFLRDRREMVTVAVAVDRIPAGVTITPSMVIASVIPANTRFVDGLVPFDRVAAGQLVAARTVQPGEPLTASVVGSAGSASGQRVMSIPLASWQAANGEVQVGDQVDVIEITKTGPVYVLLAAPVVGRSSGSGGGGLVGAARSGDLVITVEVDANQALVLAAAIDSGKVSVVRSTGAPPVDPPGTDAPTTQPVTVESTG